VTGVPYRSPAGRAVLLATILGSGVAFLDGTVVNVALPRIALSFGAGFSTMQWVLDAYLLSLGALVLVGGALGDVFGRRRVVLVGLVGFGVTSAVCGAAPTTGVLIAGRAVQGVAAALLVPGSLAIITSSIAAEDRDRAIGQWSGLAGLTSAIGPFVGGWLIDVASWRWVFFLNLPLIAAAVAVTLKGVPESHDPAVRGHGLARLDLPGAVLTAAALGLLVLPLIESRAGTGIRVGLFAGAAVAFAGFLLTEHRSAAPMLPLGLFRRRAFTVAQVVTFVVYGALGGAFFLLAVELQTGMGFSPLQAGAATAPTTVVLLVFSARVGGLIPRIGARPLLTAGPLLAGAGLLLLTRATPGQTYLTGVLPGILVFSAGMCLVVTPITATALGAVDASHAGLASGVNNAVARIGGLIAVAVLPVIAGAGTSTRLPVHGFRVAMAVTGALAAAGGLIALVGLPIRTRPVTPAADTVSV
jgi:EmrB/QacA subfamily drug resistance transporter